MRRLCAAAFVLCAAVVGAADRLGACADVRESADADGPYKLKRLEIILRRLGTARKIGSFKYCLFFSDICAGLL